IPLHNIVDAIFHGYVFSKTDVPAIVVLISRGKNRSDRGSIDRCAVSRGDVYSVMPMTRITVRIGRVAVALSDRAPTGSVFGKKIEIDGTEAVIAGPGSHSKAREG